VPPEGQRVAPFFDGFYQNGDGSITFSFGYSNLNRDEVIEIPVGPDNFIEPKQFDGGQPTSFPPVAPDEQDTPNAVNNAGSRPDRRDRERGVFAITVPPGFQGDVVWTLRYKGQTFKVPARAKTSAYQLHYPMAMGSTPPLLSFKPNGPTARGPSGIHSEPLKTTVGAPLAITVHLNDDAVREKEPVNVRERTKPRGVLNITWYKYSGPLGASVTFEPAKAPVHQPVASVTTKATFPQRGEYVLRVRADAFGRIDTSPGNQCCWTNGYVKVTVSD
jgi:hypothetical protein